MAIHLYGADYESFVDIMLEKGIHNIFDVALVFNHVYAWMILPQQQRILFDSFISKYFLCLPPPLKDYRE